MWYQCYWSFPHLNIPSVWALTQKRQWELCLFSVKRFQCHEENVVFPWTLACLNCKRLYYLILLSSNSWTYTFLFIATICNAVRVFCFVLCIFIYFFVLVMLFGTFKGSQGDISLKKVLKATHFSCVGASVCMGGECLCDKGLSEKSRLVEFVFCSLYTWSQLGDKIDKCAPPSSLSYLPLPLSSFLFLYLYILLFYSLSFTILV